MRFPPIAMMLCLTIAACSDGDPGTLGLDWRVPPGVTNPVVRRPLRGYLSDPALIAVPEQRELWLYYREVRDSNRIWRVRSSDGAHWDDKRLAAVARNNELVSPSVVRNRDGWQMWSVNASSGCSGDSATVERRTSEDGLHWSAPRTVELRAPHGFYPWHIADGR